MQSLSLLLLSLIFAGAVAMVWWAGIQLSNATDVLDQRLGWGDAFGGLILLALVTNLPDIAIVSSAAISGNVGLATGSLLGGVAIQTVVLAIMDIVGGGSGTPLTSRTRTLIPALEALMVIVGLTLIVMGSQLEPMTRFRIEPAALVIFLIWIVGLLVVRKANAGLAWKLDQSGDEPPSPASRQQDDRSTPRIAGMFLLAALITLVGGVMLERSGDAMATRLGIGNVVFGATILAAATAIPDISTGIQAVKLGNHQLAISDVFGANAFLPSLFLLAGVLSGQAVISASGATNLYLAAFGVMLMSIYLVGLVFRNHHTVFRMGFDSLLVIAVYVIGIGGLLLVG